MRDIHLQIKVGLQKGRLFDDFMKKEEHGKSDMGVSFTDDVLHYLTHANNILLSLFCNCEVYLNNRQVYNSNGLYGHKALISNEFNASTRNNEGILACHGYEFEKEPSDYEKSPFIDREEELMMKHGSIYYGKIVIDLLQCEKFPNTKVILKLFRAGPNFYLTPYNPHVSLKVLDCSLFTRRVVVNEVYHQTIKYQLTHQTACYNVMKTIARTLIIPTGQNQFVQENIFNNAPIRRVAIAMNTNSAFTRHFQENPFLYQKFGFRELRIVRGGRSIVSLDTTNDCRAYVTTMKAMNFNEEIPALPHHQFQNHYILVFDLTSLQDAGENIHYPELSGERIRLEMFFDGSLRNVTEIIVLGERMSTVKIDQFGTVAKMSNNFSSFFFDFMYFVGCTLSSCCSLNQLLIN